MNSISANEILQILAHQWAGTEDIKRIGSVGKNRALKIKKEIIQKLEESEEGYSLPRDKVPMEEVMKYFKLNIEFFGTLVY